MFTVPNDTPGGIQEVRITTPEEEFQEQLAVLGDVAAGTVVLVAKQDVRAEELQGRLADLNRDLGTNYALTQRRNGRLLRPLGGTTGPCSGSVAVVATGKRSLGQAIEELAGLGGIAIGPDPQVISRIDAVDHLQATTALEVRSIPPAGSGITIAVLDTGVSPHPQLGERLRLEQGFDALDPGGLPLDRFDVPQLMGAMSGHGTAVAVLAAGDDLGMAPKAAILPIRVCGTDGSCLGSDVLIGLCHALTYAQRRGDPGKLVITMGLGSDTPTRALKRILASALEGGASVVAAAGNQGSLGARHYPAALELGGLLAVGALAQCADFDDLAAGQRLAVGSSVKSGAWEITVEPITLASGVSVGGGEMRLTNRFLAGGSGLDAFARNAVFEFGLNHPVDGLTLQLGGFGGTINLRINDVLRVREALDQLPPIIGGVGIELLLAGPAERRQGTLILKGRISSFAIGGENLAIDNLCLGQPQPEDWFPAAFTTQGDYLDLAAPGAVLTSGRPPATTETSDESQGIQMGFAGTSLSAAQVAGVVALLRARNPALLPGDIERCLIGSALPLPDPPNAPAAVGAGMVNAAAAAARCAP